MNDMYQRTEALIGKDALDKIKKSTVCVFGLGGVGSYVVEGLVRAGVGKLIVVDYSKVDITNKNRQLIATDETIGQYKTKVIKDRALSINENIEIKTFDLFVKEENLEEIFSNETVDYIVDAIDSVQSKLDIIKYANDNKIKIISSMGTGNKLNPNAFEIADINKTSVCPLARKIRKSLQKSNIKKLEVLYSKENPNKFDKDLKVPASISFVPSVAGLIISGHVINKLIENVV